MDRGAANIVGWNTRPDNAGVIMWDLRIDQRTGDLASGYVTGQDEIIQRVCTRLWRYLGEWFVNTDCGLPWYDGPSNLIPGELTRENGILGTRNFTMADVWIRNEIAETDGVLRVVDFNTSFDATTRTYSLRAQIVTRYGLPYLLALDRQLTEKNA